MPRSLCERSCWLRRGKSHLYLPDHLNRRFRALDQGFIYLLIVGSLAPYVLTYLRTPVWIGFYGFCVATAATGFTSKVFFAHRVDRICVPHYLIQGWGQAIAMIPLAKVLPTVAVLWILAGAGFYCLGVVFLVLDIRRLRFHAIWHLLVLVACACHYFAILKFVVHGG